MVKMIIFTVMALLVGSPAMAKDQACIDRYVRLAKTIKRGDTKSVVAKKLAELGRPTSIDEHVSWHCDPEDMREGWLALRFTYGVNGKIAYVSVDSIRMEHDAFGQRQHTHENAYSKNFDAPPEF